MSATKTLTLHETKRPDTPITFTLDGDWFWMDISAVFTPAPDQDQAPVDPFEQKLEASVMTFAGRLVDSFSGPVHVKDLTFQVNGEGLFVQLWKRTRGLRLVPATIILSSIDDPEAAQAFASLVQARAQEADHPGRYAGLLDYWGSWIGMVMAVLSGFVALGWWMSRRSGRS